MQIDTTNSTMVSYLTSFLTTSINQITSGLTTSTGANSFGPSSLLSFSDDTSNDNTTVDYASEILGVSMGATSATSSTASAAQLVSQEQQKEEIEIIKQATALRLNDYFDEARDVLTGLLDKNPTNAAAIHGLGAVELDQGNYEAAEKYFRQAHYFNSTAGYDSDADNARTLMGSDDEVLEQAERMLKLEDSADAAQRLLVSLTQRSPGNATARMLLAEKLLGDGDGTNGLAQYQLAIAAAGQTELLEIESRLTDLAETAPKSAFVRNLLGQTQLRLGRSDEALESLSRASQLSEYDSAYLDDEARAYLQLGYEALAGNDFTTALNHFESAADLSGNSDAVQSALAEGLTARAEWRARVGDPARAIDDLIDAKTELAGVENEDLRSRIALDLYRAGRTLEQRHEQSGDEVGDELSAYEAALELDPDNATYRNALAGVYALQGDQYLAEGDYKNAAASYASAYETDDDTRDYRDSAIAAYIAWGDERSDLRDHTQAIKAYSLAYELNEDDDEVKFKLAEAYNTRGLFYRQLGDDYFEDAADDFQEALDLFPNNEDYLANLDSVS